MKIKIGIYTAFAVFISLSNLGFAQNTSDNNKLETGDQTMFPKVLVAEVVQQKIIPFSEFTGYLASPKTVDLRSRVGGQISSVDMPEGQLVKKGDLLFRIDSHPFQIALLEAEGHLSQAEALATQANKNHQRLKGLVNRGAISRKDYDDALSTLVASNAQVKSAKAAVESAKLNLSYTQIRSPIAGRVDRALITEGNLITGGDTSNATHLTTIVSVDPMYAYFDIDEASFNQLMQLQSSARNEAGSSLPTVAILLPNEKSTYYTGYIDFVSNLIERTTGTVKIRVVIANKAGKLTPGAFIRAQLPIGSQSLAILVDEQAIGSDQGQNYVLVLDKNNKAEYRPVELGDMVDGLQVINKGLTEGEKIIIKGLARPGMGVTPEYISMEPKLEKNTQQVKGQPALEIEENE